MHSILVLNASYEPLSIVPATRGIALIFNNKAIALDESDIVLNSESTQIKVPYVIKMNYYVKKKINTKEVPFSRKGVLVRDNHKCAYCGKSASTIDHIIPKSRGGKNTYSNAVACCNKCNGKKANYLLHETDMKLRWQPTAPSLYSSFLIKAVNNVIIYSSWSEYIFMYQPDLQHHFEKVYPHLKAA